MNNKENYLIKKGERMSINYDITNYKKFNWYDTQAYKFNGDNNNGYLYGYVQWYGDQDLDDVLDNAEDVSWSWFKTKQERDNKLRRENELQNI
jgi:hypothetical protein